VLKQPRPAISDRLPGNRCLPTHPERFFNRLDVLSDMSRVFIMVVGGVGYAAVAARPFGSRSSPDSSNCLLPNRNSSTADARIR
jgi:hypothetical protein